MQEVVGKVLLGGKTLTSLNPSQIQGSAAPNQAATTSSLNASSPTLQVTHSQSLTNQTLQSSPVSQPSQTSHSGMTSVPTRVVTVQKLPSAVVQGSGGSVSVYDNSIILLLYGCACISHSFFTFSSQSNVIVLDLSQEQINNSAVLNEILASSILQSSNTLTFNHDTVSEATATSVIPTKGPIFSNNQSGVESGL